MLSIYLVIGAFAGVMSGLFGVGGGVIVIPALSTIFLHEKMFPASSVMQMAVGTSLAIMIVTSLSSLYIHYRREAVRWNVFGIMLPFLALGAVIGAVIAHFVSSGMLQTLFGVFLFILGVRLILNSQNREQNRVVPVRIMRIASFLIGCLSSILGIGGGTIIVPFLLYCSLDMREATGTSIACGLVIGLVATICFMITGWLFNVHVPDSTGYIYWPGFIGVAVASTLFAPIGAMLAHKLPKEMLKRIFGVLLLLMAGDMLFFN